MLYNEPDKRWEILGFPDYETYVQKLVVKGLFNSQVPAEVADAFLLAEYMMAHAYYHYPLYDEAFSKLLRVIEMAVKIRCAQLSIHLTETTKNNKTKDKELAKLINELIQAEPAKDLKSILEMFRLQRNLLMHPKAHSFSGSMAYGAIITGVNMLNKLFIHGDVFEKFQVRLFQVQQQTTAFENNVFLLELDNKKALVEAIEIHSAISLDQAWVYLLVAFPVASNLSANLLADIYPLPFIFLVSDLNFEKDSFTAKESGSGKPIVVNPTSHPDHVSAYQQFITERQQMTNFAKLQLDKLVSGEIAEREESLLYHSLYKV